MTSAQMCKFLKFVHLNRSFRKNVGGVKYLKLKDHYSANNRHFLKRKKFSVLLILPILTIIMFYTYCSFFDNLTGTSAFEFAKWLLQINEEEVGSDTSDLNNTIQLINLSNGTTNIDIGDVCYFDIVINPSSTEVAVKNIIFVDLEDNNSNLPDGTIITKYEKYKVSNSELLSTTEVNSSNVTINDNILLSNDHTTLDNTDVVKYRIYCQIPEYADLVQNQRLSVKPIISVKQILGNE